MIAFDVWRRRAGALYRTVYPRRGLSDSMQLPTLDALLAPISADKPCGPNLEYTLLFAALEADTSPADPNGQLGNFIEPWRRSRLGACAGVGGDTLFTNKRPACGDCMDSGADVHPWPRRRAALQLIARLLTTWPRDVHPVVEPDEDQPPLRWLVLANLAAPRGLLHDLRGTTSGLAAPVGAVWARINDALITIREILWDTADREALPEFWRSLVHLDGFSDSGPVRSTPTLEPAAADATVWSDDHQELLESIRDLIERAGFDAPSVCRRAHRIGFEQFLDLASEVAPTHHEHAASFLQPGDSDQARRSDGRG